MSMIITLKTQLFRGDWDQARSQYALLWFMEAMCRVNQSHIRQFKNMADRGQGKPYPRLYKSGVHYERERGTEEWLDIPNILAGGSYPGEYPGAWDDCEGCACWRVAELRELDWHWAAQARDRKTGKHFTAHIDSAYPPPPGARKVPGGIKAKPFAKFKKRDDGSYAYHALTLLPDGRLEDPSLTLGMTWERDFYDRDIARKYKDGELPVQIRYADLPDVVVIDPESPTGYSSNTERAKRNAGLASDLPSGNHVNGDNTCHECTNASPQEAAAWGYNRRDVRAKDMRELRTHVNDVGFRSGRLGRLGRVGAPEANWAARFLHQSNSISTPSIGSPLVKALRKRR